MKDFEDAEIRRVGDAASGVDRTLKDILNEPAVSILDFGADPTASADSQPAMVACAEYLFSRGGGTMYIPPTTTGGFKLNSSFNPGLCTNESPDKPLNIVGAGKSGSLTNGSSLSGNFAGALIEQTFGTSNNLRMIYGLRINNDHARGIGMKIAQCQTMLIEHCAIAGKLVGIMGSGETYHTHVRSCDIQSNGGGMVGFIGGQMHVSQSRFTGWDCAVIMSNVGCSVRDSSFEVNRIGLKLGWQLCSIFTATSSGTTLTVSALHEGNIGSPTHSTTGTLLLGGYYIPTGMDLGHDAGPVAITAQTSGTPGGVGVYTTNFPTYCNNNVVMSFENSNLGGCVLNALTFERNDLAVDAWQTSSAHFSGFGVGGVVGPNRSILPGGTMAWASTAGGTVTVNTPMPHGQTGTFKVYISGYAGGPTGWNVDDVTATVVDADTFTYPLAVEPSQPFASLSEATWSKNISYGMRIRGNAGGLTCSAMSIGPTKCEGACIDLYYDGNTSIENAVFESVTAGDILSATGVSWRDPTGDARPRYKLINCKHHLPFTHISLPTGAYRNIGDEHLLSDGAKDSGGSPVLPLIGEAVTRGGGSQTIKVFWNGTSWLRIA